MRHSLYVPILPYLFLLPSSGTSADIHGLCRFGFFFPRSSLEVSLIDFVMLFHIFAVTTSESGMSIGPEIFHLLSFLLFHLSPVI